MPKEGSFWPKPEKSSTAVRHLGYGLAEETDVLTLYLSFLCFLAWSSSGIENGWNT